MLAVGLLGDNRDNERWGFPRSPVRSQNRSSVYSLQGIEADKPWEFVLSLFLPMGFCAPDYHSLITLPDSITRLE